MNFGYYRASYNIEEKKLQKHIQTLKEYGAEKIYIDINQHGRTSNRPELLKLLKEAKKGDKVIVTSSSILGKRLITVNSILNKFEKKGVYLWFPDDMLIKNSVMLRVVIEEFKEIAKKVSKEEQQFSKKIKESLNEKLKKVKEGN